MNKAERHVPGGILHPETERVLHLEGALDKMSAASVLTSSPAALDAIDLGGVTDLDSAGIALIAELIQCSLTAGGPRPVVRGRPEGLEALCRAYRIAADFSDFP